jgi:hypothetical protein
MAKKPAIPPNTPVLRVAAAWGTTIISVRILAPGEDCALGDEPGALAPKPEGIDASSVPLRAVGGGWELDARGAVSGVLTLRGREENPVAIARSGGPIPVVPGDYGLIQYGLFSVFFQYTMPAQPIAGGVRVDPLVGLAQFSSVVFHLGLIGLFLVNWTPGDYHLPPELVPDFATQFHLNKDLLEDAAKADKKDDNGGGKGIKDPGAHDTKKQGGGRKIAGKEGKAGVNGKEDHTELQGEIKPVTNYGGLSEALADTGTEIRKTLNQIQTVTEALGGLNSDNVVLGAGSGTGLKGAGAGGGGNGAGVMFGSGTMDTGWGPGMGGGFGAGGGGAGGRGSGGFGNGGAGGGNGTGNGTGNGPGEHGVGAGGGAGPVHGGLTAEQIRRVVLSHQGALRACYEIEAQKDPTLRGGVTVAWTIDPSGAVTSANLAGSTIHNARVEGCVVRQVRNWHFPTSDGTSQPTWPFAFGIGH